MSSLVGVFGQASAPTYAATKGAITSFSKALVGCYVTSLEFVHYLEYPQFGTYELYACGITISWQRLSMKQRTTFV